MVFGVVLFLPRFLPLSSPSTSVSAQRIRSNSFFRSSTMSTLLAYRVRFLASGRDAIDTVVRDTQVGHSLFFNARRGRGSGRGSHREYTRWLDVINLFSYAQKSWAEVVTPLRDTMSLVHAQQRHGIRSFGLMKQLD